MESINNRSKKWKSSQYRRNKQRKRQAVNQSQNQRVKQNDKYSILIQFIIAI